MNTRCDACKEKTLISKQISTYLGIYGDEWGRKMEERYESLVCTCYKPSVDNSTHTPINIRDQKRFISRFGTKFDTYADYFSNPEIPNFPEVLNKEKNILFPWRMDIFRKIEDKEFIIFAHHYHNGNEKYASDKDMRCYLKIIPSGSVNYKEVNPEEFLNEHIAFENANELVEYLEGNFGLGDYFKGNLSEYSGLSDYGKYRYANL